MKYKGLWALVLVPFVVAVIVILVQIQVANPNPTTISHTVRTNQAMKALDSSLPRDVDIVYTWVDSSDEDWRQQRNQYTQRRIRAHLPMVRAQLKTSEIRWPVLESDLSELALSVSTVRKFLPWVRNIYVVTQRPQKIDDPSLNFVHHDELMDPGNLPTFNSQAIETSLHKIPGLSEHFIYINDDFYAGKPMEISDFFSTNGKPIFFPGKKTHNWAVKQPWFARQSRKGIGAMPAVANMKRIMPHNVYYTNHMAAP